MAKTKTINLLPQEEFEASTLGRLLRWATGTFRILVIVTEMIVMAAFLSRFWLDAQNSDLAESQRIKSAQISAQSEVEKSFRDTQRKIDIFKKINDFPSPSEKIGLVASQIPSDVVLTSIAVGEKTSEIRGVSGSELGVAQFVSNLKTEELFKTVELGSVGTSQDNPAAIEFSLSIEF
ncbi:MAG TPA: PilN domain-containing protein [Patescibacteria group bacterium]|nr:PilN domain-containing protein [Patescibacteria group bacterium]